MPRPDIAPLLQERFVALASDVDEPEPEVLRLLSELKNATMLPFVVLADGEGNFLDGSAGAVQPERLKTMLEGVLA